MWDWFIMVWKAVKSAVTGAPKGETVVWEREKAVYRALSAIIATDQPCCLGGRYSWLTSPVTGMPLQIDIFYPKITTIADIELTVPRALAVEVQSSLHDGKWNASKRRFFRTKEDFERYTKNQEWKRKQILGRKIPFIEIDPSKDDLSPTALRKKLAKALGILL